MRTFAMFAASATMLTAAYAYFFTDTFASGVNSTNWYTNGTVSTGTDGLTSTSSSGGSVIFKPAIPDGTSEYELKATLRIAASGGSYVIYLQASSDSLTGPSTQGTYNAIELTPTLSGGGCTMVANHYRRVSGSVTLVASHNLACADNMWVRVAQ